MRPKRPTFWLLDTRTGWRTARVEKVNVGEVIRLATHPDGPLALNSADGSLGGLTLPRGMALDEKGTLYLLGLDEPWIKRFDPASQRFEKLPKVGGNGQEPRQFREPRNIAVGDSSLYVADWGNHRIQVFDLKSLALRHVWGPWSAEMEQVALGATEVWEPIDVVAHEGAAYILDRRYGRVYRHLPGTDFLCLTIHEPEGVNRWTRVAIDRNGRIYLLDPEKPCLEIYDPEGRRLGQTQDAGDVRGRFDAPPVRLDHKERFCLPESLVRLCSRRAPSKLPRPEVPLGLCPPWTRPQAIRAPLLRVDDLKDPTRLTVRLQKGRDCITQYLRNQLSSETRQMLNGYDALLPPSEKLQRAMVDELNRLLKGKCIYEEQRFAQVALTRETRALLKQKPEGDELIRLNRLLLEAAYPFEIERSPAVPQGGLIFNRQGNRVRSIDPAEEDWSPKLYETSGTWISEGLDSKIYRCQWHRIETDLAELPAGSQIVVSTYTDAQERQPEEIGALSDHLWDTRYAITGKMQPPPGPDSDPNEVHEFLVQSREGRYLWLKAELTGNGYATPALKSIRVHYPRQSYLEYLPAVYAADDESRWFLDRFLSIFQTEWDDLERRIEEIALYFDPKAVPERDFLEYLARWMALPLEGVWNWEQKRHLLTAVPEIYPRRGTIDGLRSYLRVYLQNITGFAPEEQMDYPQIVEGFRERQRLMLSIEDFSNLGLGAPLWSPSQVGRLQLDVFSREGEVRLVSTGDPERDIFHEFAHRFRVFVPSAWIRTAEEESMFCRALEAEKPAHTQYDLCLVEPRFRVSLQSTVGIDTIIGNYPVARLACTHETDAPSNRPPRHLLGYDTILGGRPEDGPFLQLLPGTRVGMDTILS